jgi:putative endonuclease
MEEQWYCVYILTNFTRTTLYTGVTNDLVRRIEEHFADSQSAKKSFAGKYNCYNLVYWEAHKYILNAIAREKEIKGWTRAKKESLITSFNPEWKFLNGEIGL